MYEIKPMIRSLNPDEWRDIMFKYWGNRDVILWVTSYTYNEESDPAMTLVSFASNDGSVLLKYLDYPINNTIYLC